MQGENGGSLLKHLMGLPCGLSGKDHKLTDPVKIKIGWMSLDEVKDDVFIIDLVTDTACFGLDQHGNQRSKPYWAVMRWEVIP